MISIEEVASHKERFKFNRPFGGVDIRFGNSASELPNVNWRLRTIAWLDYDDGLSPSILSDVRTIATNAISGNMLVVSIQCERPPLIKEDDEFRPIESLEEFKTVFGPARMPVDLEMKDFDGWKLAATVREILLSEIDDALLTINTSRPTSQQLEFKQVSAFEYADGAKMTTIAGVFVDRGQTAIFSSCGFDELPFYRTRGEVFRIDIPKLTPKEMRTLEGKLPSSDPGSVDPGPFPKRDVVAFATLYRYLPRFVSFEQDT